MRDTGSSLVVSVDMDRDVPARLSRGEVMGLGVDLYRGDAGESDYQLFADGSADGWYAYLQTPQGFVEYPGELRMGGTRIVFDVPWHSVGQTGHGRFRAFADWSMSNGVPRPASEDFAPDGGTAEFRP